MDRNFPPKSSPPLPEMLTGPVMDALCQALRGVRFGTVTVIIQDSKVVQIDRTDRLRLKQDAHS